MQSVSLWCDYVNFVQEYDPSVCECSPAGSSKARDLFERALIAAGLHVAEGSKIWEAYRKYEEAIFNTISETDTEVELQVSFISAFCNYISQSFLVFFISVLIRLNGLTWPSMHPS